MFSPSLSSGVCTRKFFSPLLPEYRRGEANFATARELAESLARFGPPGFRLGTPSPGLAPGGSVIGELLIVLLLIRLVLIVLILCPAAVAGAVTRRDRAAAVGPLLPVLAPDIFRWSWTVCSFPVAVCK